MVFSVGDPNMKGTTRRVGQDPVRLEFATPRPPEFREFLPERRGPGLRFTVALSKGHQDTDAPHPVRLLRGRRERPRGRRATQQRDELPPFQLIELHSVPASQGRITGYRIGKDQSGGNGNDFTRRR